MAKQTINLGTLGTASGDTVRDAFDKCNDNFNELYGGKGAVIYHGSLVGQSYSTSSTSYSNTSTIVSSVPAGTYVAILTVAGGTQVIDDSGYMKIRDASMGDIGLWIKWSKHQIGTDDLGNAVSTAMSIVTLTQTCNLYGQYKRIAGIGTVSISDIKLAMIKVA